METEDLPEVVTTGQAARLLRVHTNTLRRWEREGYLKPVQTSSRGHYYRKSDIVTLLSGQVYNPGLSQLTSRELLTALAKLMRTVSSTLDLRQMAQTVIHEAVSVIGSHRSAIYLLNDNKTLLIPFVGVDLPQTFTPEIFHTNPLPLAAQGQLGGELLQGHTVSVSDTATDPRCNHEFFSVVDTRALLMAPLKNRAGDLQGFLSFFWAGQPHLFTEEEFIFAEALAGQTGIALENSQLHEAQHARATELETLFDTLTDGVAVYDSNLKLLRINKMTRQILPHFESLLQASHPERTERYNTRKLNGEPLRWNETPAYRAAVAGETVNNYEMLLEGESGPDTVINCSATPLYDENGSLCGAISVFRNVTGEYRTQARIIQLSELAQANAAQLKAIIESVAQGVLVYDTNNRIVLVNKRLTELYGFSKEEIVGLTSAEFAEKVKSLVSESDKISIGLQPLEQLDTTSYTDELEIIRPAPRTFERNVTPVLNPLGNLLGKVALYRDVTEERALVRAKDEFLSLAAHELKTPLTAVMGYAQVLVNRLERHAKEVSGVGLNVPEALLTAANRINQQAVHLNELISDLLDLSRLTAGRLQMQKRPTDLIELVRHTLEQVQVTTTRHEITLVEQFKLSQPILCDPTRIEQVLRNLLENAVKYNPAGGPIQVIVSADKEAPAEVTIAVRDQGIGVSPEEQAHLFEKFYRTTQASAVSVGLGLGLSISAEIVRLHGGRIWVESAGENQGSTFAFTLPLLDEL